MTASRRAGQHVRTVASAARRAARNPRHLLIALGSIVFAIILAPLAYDLFLAIPWSVRKAAGQLLFLALIGLGLVHICRGRPHEIWPPLPSPSAPDSAFDRWSRRLIPWLLQAGVASLAWPLLHRSDGIGFGDWEFFLGHYEAARRTIAIWGQFPWWNPWCRGGFPLAANPQIGVVSPAMPLVLWLGTGPGLRLASVGWMMLAVEGTRRLAAVWFRDPYAQALAALVYGLNAGIMIYAVSGYQISMSYWVVPWLLLGTIELAHGRLAGLRLGAWLALAVLTSIYYPLVYGLVIALALALRTLSASPGQTRIRWLIESLAALGLLLALAGWRLATTASVMRDFPRIRVPTFEPSLVYILACWIGRPSRPELEATIPPVFWETNVCVGGVVIALTLASLALGLRGWHVLALVGIALSWGGTTWYQPSYWLSQWPLFSTLHVVQRWRLIAALGVGLAAAAAIAAGRASPRSSVRLASLLAVAWIGLDLIAYGHQILPIAHGQPFQPSMLPGPPVRDPISVRRGFDGPLVAAGYANLEGYEPQLGYDRAAPTARSAWGEPGYRGEAWTDLGPATPLSWSPNRITFALSPGDQVEINQNPGSWWTQNGRRLAPVMRSAEPEGRFVVTADPSGRAEISIQPRGLALGMALHALGLGLLAVWYFARRRFGADDSRSLRPSGPAAPSPDPRPSAGNPGPGSDT